MNGPRIEPEIRPQNSRLLPADRALSGEDHRRQRLRADDSSQIGHVHLPIFHQPFEQFERRNLRRIDGVVLRIV
jgi:hypothetical protein